MSISIQIIYDRGPNLKIDEALCTKRKTVLGPFSDRSLPLTPSPF